ncbi:OsmC family protein [Oleiagrimonas sp. C23AA]|uniref:OsmC family protein n=1 Tax=Oleiagrimonas sp. C23AA TaxID=2719047 RepID=UPI00141FE53A|nr:OsmC family protein [Oleiagrimonas sp. C23AA]NII10226.1 OsmC family peroxiredoxin [Oleiagrimonas sp. C23AA]
MSAPHPHHYRTELEWTGNRGEGTRTYRSYRRDYVLRIDGKPDLAGSSDATFHGDAARHNPEDMLMAALSACHMLSYLHMAAVGGVVVLAYRDLARGRMVTQGSSGRFVEVVLKPEVSIDAASDADKAVALHDDAHHACFIANSVNFPVRCEPRIVRVDTDARPVSPI